MNARGRIAAILSVSLMSGILVHAQSRQGRRGATPPNTPPPAANRGTSSPAPSPAGGPGRVSTPAGGYVVMPTSPPPGTTVPARIPSDPIELSFWELYDRDRRVTLEGKVTRVDWSNPNVYIFITASGVNWAVESSFIQFRQSSVNPAIRADETVTISGFLPKDDPEGPVASKTSPTIASYLKEKHLMRAGEITTVFGQKLGMGQPPTEAEMATRLRCSPLGC